MFLGNIEHPDQISEIMSVNRTEIFQIEFSEDTRIYYGFPEGILDVFHAVINNFAEVRFIQRLLHGKLQIVVRGCGTEPCKTTGQSTDIAGDGHVVVIEDNDHLPLLTADLVQSFQRFS